MREMNSEIIDNSYNWDDLEVGQFDLNHSESFFSRKHSKHEKFEAILREMNNEKSNNLKRSNSLNKKNPLNMVNNILKESNFKSTSNLNMKDSKTSKQQNNLSNGDARDCDLPNVLKENNSKLAVTNAACRIKRTKSVPPAVCKYLDIYKKHKEQMRVKMLDEEKKNRIFHSKPAPNFSALHAKQLPQPDQRLPLTTPITPLVYKKSKELEERRKKKLEEYKKRNELPRFTSRPAQVLHEEPFKPKKPERQVELEPFNLHVERRLGERKLFDEQLKKMMEQKKRQEEQEKRKAEEELIREFRKATTFKAQPNPFRPKV